MAAFVESQQWTRLPSSLRETALHHLVDTLGCCLANVGSSTWKALAFKCGAWGAGEASAAGVPDLVSGNQAAFVNGLLARSAEFDDMAMPDLHPGGVMVPAVLAAAESSGSSGVEMLTALAVGFEVMLRLGRAAYDERARSSRFLARGQDATAICGTVASAAAAARLYGLGSAGIAHAMGIAVSLAGGSLEANRSGGTVKQFQSGWAAQSGLAAATLAAQGVTGPQLALEGRYGFYQCFTGGEFDAGMLVSDLGVRWEASDLRYKPYPSNYYTHAGIDAALALRRRGLDPAEVTAVRQYVAAPMLRTMGSPLETKQRPRNGYAAKFSGPFTVASALLGGGGLGLGPADFDDERVTDPVRHALMDRITVRASPECDRIFPDHAPCVLEAETSDGKLWREEVWSNRGSSQNPLTGEEVKRKFDDNARCSLTQAETQSLYEQLIALPAAPDTTAVMTALRSASPERCEP
ncbi:MmgE/PrpD family protein [Streptomyces olivoreticuli]